MAPRFTVLASGSTGNVAVLDCDGDAVLVDCGLGPRKLARALAGVGMAVTDIRAVLLTHLHNDHWNEYALAQLRDVGATLWCHQEHAVHLQASAAFQDLEQAGLVGRFDLGGRFECGPCSAVAFGVAHDTFTCGFRLEVPGAGVVGFASDLGSWDDEVAQNLSDVDVLAIEFNHDVRMQETSRRSPFLIRRNLGRDGHLSNAQAARLLDAILARSRTRTLRHLVALHLSRQCNRPEFAVAAAETVRRTRRADFDIQAAAPFDPLPWLCLADRHVSPLPVRATSRRRSQVVSPDACQPFFPGWD